jgi:hypothetical protein
MSNRAGQTASKAGPPDASKKTDCAATPNTTCGYALRSGMSTWTCALKHAGAFRFV